MGDFGDCLEPREPENPDTLEWARRTSREVQTEHAESRPYNKPLREFAEGRLYQQLESGARYYPRDRDIPERPVAPSDPAAEIQAALREYDKAVAAGDFTLPDAPARAPGTCEYCSGPVGRAGGTVCRYCQDEGTERLAADKRHPVPELREDHPLRQLAPPSVRAGRRAGRGIADAVVKGIAAGLIVAIVLLALAHMIGGLAG